MAVMQGAANPTPSPDDAFEDPTTSGSSMLFASS